MWSAGDDEGDDSDLDERWGVGREGLSFFWFVYYGIRQVCFCFSSGLTET